MKRKEFKVVAVSENNNSFGLRQMIVVARDGETYKVCSNSLNVRDVNEIIPMTIFTHPITHIDIRRTFDGNYELQQKQEDCSASMLSLIWEERPPVLISTIHKFNLN
jgi:hypothetical protein